MSLVCTVCLYVCVSFLLSLHYYTYLWYYFYPNNNPSSLYLIIHTHTQVEDVEVIIPFSRAVRTANFKVSVGSVLFDEASKVARWEVGKLQAERFPQLTATILYQPNSKGKDEAPTLQMQWKVASATVSGLAVAALQLTNERYKPYKGVRTIAKGGKFQIRCV